MGKYIPESYLYRAIGADINGACGRCPQTRSGCMCQSLSRMDICGIIEDAPGADVKPVVRGEWIKKNDDISYRIVCSVCGARAFISEWQVIETRYCPNCGADMRGTDDGA